MTRKIRHTIAAFGALACAAIFVPVAGAQESVPRDSAEALRVYLDCRFCDFDFFRTEIRFVNWVRQRQDAALYVLVTTQRTGGGGTEFTVGFIGQGEFDGHEDTLRYISRQTDTDDEERRGLARTLALGLVRYAAHTPAADRLRVTYQAPGAGEADRREVRDPWSAWVFRLSANGNLNGEKRSRSRSYNWSGSANRVTEMWKIRFSWNDRRSRNDYELDDTTTYVSRSKDWRFNSLVARSLGAHWSAGARASVSSSSFVNQDLRVRLAPAIEFDLYPYSESTRRQLTFNYSVGVERVDYEEVTLYGKTRETLSGHSLGISFDARERWGSASASVGGSQYLGSPRKFNANLSAGMGLRLTRGLELNGFGFYSVIRDQIYLAAAGATPEEILARQRQLATSYRLGASFGVSYSFGSIYNNVVNPRFEQ